MKKFAFSFVDKREKRVSAKMPTNLGSLYVPPKKMNKPMHD